MLLEFVIGVLLLFLSYLDIRYHEVPSFIPTTFILALVLLQPENIPFGVAGALFGLALFELDFVGNRFFGGLADIKVVTIIGLTINSLFMFSIMMALLGGLSFLSSIILTFYYKGKIPKEIPFIPVLFILYILVTGIGYWIL